ncbi:pyrimidine-nucleoside phosphorylase [Pseudobutyrivibrio sp. ACV-2]|uniref:pyrimidine-nucleoside phosphorylase n=1 Tax=Pseudobutyrivibrio sp. ACV-2 TaxID=1520801 RepID=UPI000896F8B6|nr:pyrimidine-nucleoside phosphorylase [Pseudobutyrivibrio sp. ACV-2]SDZ82644.1 pyrimidine-nucleoside phosphorylase [Pseudobutyrivibrio sp. ACV-2]
MRMYDLIEKKKLGEELSTEEIYHIINGYTHDEIPDYQISALLMAIYFNGMNVRERYDLTMAMRDSGDILDLSSIDGVKIDKHSTGGVGDKVTLVLGPIIASIGVPVAKMSGRGLGHTGGTIDKLEAFPGFNGALSEEAFINQVNSIKIAVTGQSKNLAPADKKLYALRDVTATVDEISLITGSIMSKKLAAGTDAIVLDVTVGDGAFMKNKESALELAKSMVDIGKRADKKIAAVLTNMDEPLGFAVGNNLEVIEAINALKGNGPEDLMEVVFELGSQMIVFSGIETDKAKAKELMKKAIESGAAFDKFVQFIEAQGGDASFARDINKFAPAKHIVPLLAESDGYVHAIKAEAIGLASMSLGGGRETFDDVIDMAVGVVLNKKVGDEIKKGEPICFIHANDESKIAYASDMIRKATSIQPEKCNHMDLIIDIVE